jgi:signal transduction histidine kinase
VVSIALLHDVVLVLLPEHSHPFSVGDAMTSASLVLPVIYSALTFGVRGSVATSLWATTLIVPHWFLMRELSGVHLIIESVNLAVINLVAIVVGHRVERERRARLQAEHALHLAQMASTLYQSLFEEQPAPVVITDASGVIGELNSAATQLFGTTTVGRLLQDVVGRPVDDLVDGKTSCLHVTDTRGEERTFVPTACALDTGGDRRLTQIVLTDITEQRRRQEEQSLFSARLLAVQEEERKYLAQELHDEPVQNLVYLTRAIEDLRENEALPAGLVPVIQRNGQIAAETTTALRKLIHGLRPPLLDDIGLVPALRRLVADVSERGRIVVELRCTGTENELSADLKLTVYRIVQESLNNVLRHACASSAWVDVRFDRPLSLTVSDDGQGIPLGREATPGLGITGMRERATMAGGTLQVTQREGRGTVVCAVLPGG